MILLVCISVCGFGVCKTSLDNDCTEYWSFGQPGNILDKYSGTGPFSALENVKAFDS